MEELYELKLTHDELDMIHVVFREVLNQDTGIEELDTITRSVAKKAYQLHSTILHNENHNHHA